MKISDLLEVQNLETAPVLLPENAIRAFPT
jgi:hypothetical protein